MTDLAVHPKTRNAYLSVMRGQGATAAPVLLRVDGAGKIEVMGFDQIKYSKVELPNPPAANEANPARNPRTASITDMAFVDGRLYVAGLSNEEFSSTLPFETITSMKGVEQLDLLDANHTIVLARSDARALNLAVMALP